MESVIVFGGSLGIGRAAAKDFLEKGFKVSAFARNMPGLESLRDEARESGMFINIIRGDVGNMDEVADAFDSHKKAYGEYPSFTINAAGIQGALGPAWTLSQEDFEAVIKVNLTGCFNVSKTAVSALIEENRPGSIIHFSGGGSCNARPNFSSYGVSKTGVLRLVETIAEELKLAGYEDIIINAVAPGAVKTRMTEEVIIAGEKAGGSALLEAEKTSAGGGTDLKDVIKLVGFLCDRNQNMGISGRLIHFRDEYGKFALVHRGAAYRQAGMLRRIKLI